MGKRPLLIVTLLLLGFIFAIVVFRALFSAFQTASTTTSGVKTDSTTSAQKIYFQAGNLAGSTAPYKTVSDPKFPGLSVYWVRLSVDGGNDTCTLYDNSTNQIYANRYRNDGQIGGPKTGWMYYANDLIAKDKASAFLDDVCFIN